ncbi:MAG: glycerate kinase [Bacillota bacterium]
MKKMKIVVAPDSFKGSLTANEICTIVKTVAEEVFEGCEVVGIPVADGGEGTVDSILQALNGNRIDLKVQNALGQKISTYYGIFNESCAIMEMASASGLPLIPEKERDVMQSNTYGTGEMILHAMENGCETIYIGIGGSATNDCGIGCMEALGVVFLDDSGQKINPVPDNFMKITKIDTVNLHEKIKDTKIIIMSDVKNLVLGERGATNVFGPQKGASKEQLLILEKGMEHIVNLMEKSQNIELKMIEGGGGAGGLGAGLFAFTHATMQSGVETVLDILEFKEKTKGADLIVTGEGMMDYQSAYGKVAYGVGNIAKEQNIPCVAVVGGLGKNAEVMFSHGIDTMTTTVNGIMTLDEAMAEAEQLCMQSVRRLFRAIAVGMTMKTE